MLSGSGQRWNVIQVPALPSSWQHEGETRAEGAPGRVHQEHVEPKPQSGRWKLPRLEKEEIAGVDGMDVKNIPSRRLYLEQLTKW